MNQTTANIPYSSDAEQAVLGGLMLDNERWDDVLPLLGEPALMPELSGKGNTVELAPALQQEDTGGPTVPEMQGGGSSMVLDSALHESTGDADDEPQETQEEETPTTKTEPRVETQPDLYGAPSVLSGDIETVLDGGHTTVNEAPLSTLSANGQALMAHLDTLSKDIHASYWAQAVEQGKRYVEADIAIGELEIW